MKDMTTIVKTLIARGRNFTIVHHQGMYCAIEDKYIDADGKVNQALNGFQMNASKIIEECVQRTLDRVETDYLIDAGYTKAQAFAKVNNLPVEACEALFAEMDKIIAQA